MGNSQRDRDFSSTALILYSSRAAPFIPVRKEALVNAQ